MAGYLKYFDHFSKVVWGEAPEVEKNPNPVRFGILGAAKIAPRALIKPSRSHPDMTIDAVAARQLSKAQSFADEWAIPKAYGSYEELLEDKDIDVIYNALPNALHFEWARKALLAGKHVLLEKPCTSNAKEARELADLAREKNLILLEAYHYQFHPAVHEFKKLVSDPSRGRLLKTYAEMTMPAGNTDDSDVRHQYSLGGGSLMDLAYTVSSTYYYTGGLALKEVNFAQAEPLASDSRVDRSMRATLVFDNPGDEIESEIYTDLNRPSFWNRIFPLPSYIFRAETEKSHLRFQWNIFPNRYHYFEIIDKATGSKSYSKAYLGGLWGKERGHPLWSTYRWMLEAFVERVKTGERPAHWINLEESIAVMEIIDRIYSKAELPLRGSLQ